MATTPAGVRGGGEVSVPIPGASAGAAAGGELQLQQRERSLNRFVRAVAFWEWAGNAFGALAFLWATGVLLGGLRSAGTVGHCSTAGFGRLNSIL